MSKKNRQIKIEGKEINIQSIGKDDFISLTDMLKVKESNFFVSNWLRNRNTLEYLEAWESIHNPNFNYVEFDTIKKNAGLNSFRLSVKEWIDKTNAIGIVSTAGRYGGTYAHKDLAFHFGMWISPKFQLYLIKEYQRLKDFENNYYHLEWNVKRILSKANYHIHTDAIQKYIIPKNSKDKLQEILTYAEEADLLNLALFGCTAKQWREANAEQNKEGLNIRDLASINELAILSNLENLNALWIKEGIDKKDRYYKLKELAEYQLEILNKQDLLKTLKKIDLSGNIQNDIDENK